jgi:ZIP family zinc transporter
MVEAFLWGSGAASSLLIGAAIALKWRMPRLTLGLITAFGVGVLMSAVAFELVEEAAQLGHHHHIIALGLLVGSLTFFFGTWVIEKQGNGRATRKSSDSSPFAIFVGTALDGIPESIVLGLSLIGDRTVSIGMLVAVFLSNLPEAIAATTDLRTAKWRSGPILLLWLGIVAVSGVAALAGFAIFSSFSPTVTAFTLSFAAGALITMLADAMMPDAYKESRNYAGIATTAGFFVAFWINQIT